MANSDSVAVGLSETIASGRWSTVIVSVDPVAPLTTSTGNPDAPGLWAGWDEAESFGAPHAASIAASSSAPTMARGDRAEEE